LLDKTEDKILVSDVQLALANAANQITDPEKRSSALLQALTLIKQKSKIIPFWQIQEEGRHYPPF